MISLKRLMNLFYFDFVYNKKYYLLLITKIFLTAIGIYFILRSFNINKINKYSVVNINIAILSIFLVAIGITSVIKLNKPINDPLKNIFYFTLPVLTFERFLLTIIKFLILYPIFLLTIYLSIYNFLTFIDNLMFNIKHPYLFGSIFYSKIKIILDSYLKYLVLFPIFFIGSIVFKKNTLIKTTVLLLFISILFFCFINLLFYLYLKIFYSANNFNLVNIIDIVENPKMDLYIYLVSALLYIVSYLKLKEYELKS